MKKIRLEDLSVGDWVNVSWEIANSDDYTPPKPCVVKGVVDNGGGCYDVFMATDKSSGELIGSADLSRITPIPITRKILLNNGFVRNKECSYMYHNKDVGFTFECFTKNNNAVSNSYKRGKVHIIGENIRYVHQLQCLLRFAGIGERIKL